MRTGESRDHNTYDGTGHCRHWEQAERTAAELTGFARRIKAASDGGPSGAPHSRQ